MERFRQIIKRQKNSSFEKKELLFFCKYQRCAPFKYQIPAFKYVANNNQRK